MKKNALLVFSILSILLGCRGIEPAKTAITGTWVSEEGGKLIFKNDGSFLSLSLPTKLFLREGEEKNKIFDGSGIWEITKGQSHWEVSLDFKQTSIQVNNFGQQLLIGGDGILENKPPWYLFLWKGEEGGDRYELKKQ